LIHRGDDYQIGLAPFERACDDRSAEPWRHERSDKETVIMYPRVSILILIAIVCTFSARFGRRRRQSGRHVTPRDTVLVMTTTWVLAWVWLGLPPLVDWGRHMPWSEVIPAALFLLGLAIAPLVLVLAATWLPRLFAVGDCTEKKTWVSHPVD
jgi:hypothetical protein